MTAELNTGSHTLGAPKARLLVALVALTLAAAAVFARRSVPDGDALVHEMSGATMGTTYSLKLVATSLSEDAYEPLQVAVDAWLEHVDASMSTYRPESELSRFNAHASTTPFPVSEDVLEVFRVAESVSAASNGAFDVTVGPLVDAWGFGPGRGPETIPDEARIDALRAHVGFERIKVDSSASTLTKLDPGVTADLSGVAKGYAVDGLAEVLLDHGFSNFLVEVGGELRAGGQKPDGTAWVVGIEAPLTDTRRLYASMAIGDESVATSGDYRNFWDFDGVRYAHIIDPRTGRPMPYVGEAVTVLHERAALADAWATAMTVLGPDAGLALANELELGVVFVQQSKDGLVERRSTRAANRH